MLYRETDNNMENYVCVHGHFYQPPRENPWLEAIELQDSAYPYHNWNERIALECYAPNAASRILDGEGKIVQIVNNYSRISFNMGPTLLAWLEAEAPETYQAVLWADARSMERFGGHGSALAQPYNHMIMPLANRRDKQTQVLWGIRDFQRRFGRRPAGMWLPETAVDLETLDVLAEFGIRFTVLEPGQAKRFRREDNGEWHDVNGGRIDTNRPYVQRLPSGREISVFFYDGSTARAVAFEGLLRNGDALADRLLGGFGDGPGPKLVNIATDGETFGHHHRHGEMALAYALHKIQSSDDVRLTNYSEFLANHPPTDEVEIFENTSWSCEHGIERWRSDCGCNTGRDGGWNQAWRAGLREALDWLRDELAPRFEEEAAKFFGDPWAARDDFIDVILDRSDETVEAYFARHTTRHLDQDELVAALQLMELQRHAQLMYTSCGWFFDELTGIETVQVIQYAARAIQLAEQLFGNGAEAGFLERLAGAKSNISRYGDGRQVYEDFVRPAMVDLVKVGGHYGVSSVFEPPAQSSRVYCYEVELEDSLRRDSGKARLAVGRALVTSMITRATANLSFAVIHFGDHNVNGGVGRYAGDEDYHSLVTEAGDAFERGDFAQVVRVMDEHFRASTYSLKSLFRDQQRLILNRILEAPLDRAEGAYDRIYEDHAPLLRFLAELRIPLPNAFQSAAEFVLNTSLARMFEDPELDLAKAENLLDDAQIIGISLHTAALGFALKDSLETLVHGLADQPEDLSLLERLDQLVRFANALPFEVNMWRVQNVYCDMQRRICPDFRSRAEQGDAGAQKWVASFDRLGERLSVVV